MQADSATTHSPVRASRWLYLVVSVAGSVVIAIDFLVPADRRGQYPVVIGFVLFLNGLGLINVLGGRIRIYDGALAVSGFFGTPRVQLSELRSFSVYRSGVRREHWHLMFTDAAGRRAVISFSGVPARERERVLAVLRPYVLAPGVQLSGPGEEAMAGELWGSFLRRRSG